MIPKKLNIKGTEWKVKRKFPLLDEDGNPCLGLCDYENHTIYLEKGMKRSHATEVFFHEFLHALLHEIHLDLGRAADEMVVESITKESLKYFLISTKRKGL